MKTTVTLYLPYTETEVLEILRRQGALTSHEISEALDMPMDSVRPAVTRLKARGLVRRTGQRRLTPTGRTSWVWAVVQ